MYLLVQMLIYTWMERGTVVLGGRRGLHVMCLSVVHVHVHVHVGIPSIYFFDHIAIVMLMMCQFKTYRGPG